MKCVSDGAVKFTKGGTRQNKANAKAVMELIDKYSQDEEAVFSIGIITPYTGQVALLKALFIEKDYNLDFRERVKIGTVHTFQGSECDIIIFDMVDCSKFEKGKQSYFGKIYAGEQGEQLLNVAISRAKHKLIVVCEPDYLRTCPGESISDKSRCIFMKLLEARKTQQ
jgi:superfamily I DNA and/or RNA helicase